MSTLTVSGNLGGDAALKYTSSGTPVLEFSVADQKRRKTDSGWEDDGPATWYRCSMWGPLAETFANANLLTKGASVTVTGSLTARTWEKDGRTGVSLDVRVDTIGVREKRNAARPAAPASDPWAADGQASQEPPW